MIRVLSLRFNLRLDQTKHLKFIAYRQHNKAFRSERKWLIGSKSVYKCNLSDCSDISTCGHWASITKNKLSVIFPYIADIVIISSLVTCSWLEIAHTLLAIKQEALLQIEIEDGHYHKTAKLSEIKRYLKTHFTPENISAFYQTFWWGQILLLLISTSFNNHYKLPLTPDLLQLRLTNHMG